MGYKTVLRDKSSCQVEHQEMIQLPRLKKEEDPNGHSPLQRRPGLAQAAPRAPGDVGGW